MHIGLDDDERIIFPHMYKDNRDLYDKICGVGYLIRGTEPNSRVDWVWDTQLDSVSRRADIVILQKILIVRLRLPWIDVDYEFLVTQGELDENREDYQVLAVYLQLRDLQTGEFLDRADPREFEENRDKYEVLDARYLVCWRMSEESERRLLDIDPDHVHLSLGE
jgi:hypothetical protein